jgi:putative transcriptional regulator
MATKRKFKSDAFEAIHSSASAMYRVGAIDKATMSRFVASCCLIGARRLTETG